MKYLFLIFILISDGIPDLNRKVLEYADSVMGTTVGRGECWDLAAGALDYAGAYLDRSDISKIYIFGKELNPKKDTIYPGDIIQLEDVLLENKTTNSIIRQTMTQHTAIIYEILGNNHYRIAHQNNSFSGDKVGVSELNLNHMTKGKAIFYRPFAK